MEKERVTTTSREAGRYRELLRDRDLVLTALWACLLVSGQYALLAFLALDIHETNHFSLGAAVAFLAVAQAGGVVGRTGWGYLSDRAFGGNRRPLLALITCAGLISAFALAALPGAVPLPVLLAVTFVAGASLLGWPGLWITLVCELGGPSRAGAATGFSLTFVTFASFVSPPVYGLVIDVTDSFRAMWLALAGVLVASLLVLRLVRERPERPSTEQ
jgi:sugar phosphate permease